MRKLIAVAFLAGALAACGDAAEEADDTATEEAAPAETAALALDGGPFAGVYEVTSADGATVMTETVNADGTVTNVMGEETRTGTWTSTGPDNYCATYEGDTEASCYTETMSADGVWSAVNVNDPEDAWTVKRVS